MSFDLLAPHYRWMERLLAGEKIQRCRTTFISEAASARNVLLCGEGSGRFLEVFLRINRHAKVVCVDSSRRMLDATAATLSVEDRARVHFVHADILQWPAPIACYDLIVTNFFLDCFQREQIASLVAKLSESALPQAMWLLADFNVPQRNPARARSRLILWLMYRFFRVTTNLPATHLVAPDSFLQANRFRLVKQQLSEWGLLRADLWRRE